MQQEIFILLMFAFISTAHPHINSIVFSDKVASSESQEAFKINFTPTYEKLLNLSKASNQIEHWIKWKNSNITYKVSKYPDSLLKSDVDDVFLKAFGMWQPHAALKFIRKFRGAVDITIRFMDFRQNHETSYSFYPGPHEISGDIFITKNEDWLKDSKKNLQDRLIFRIAVHEIGHALGIQRHSNNHNSIMNAAYLNATLGALDIEDIEAVRNLYGPKIFDFTQFDIIE